MRQQSHPLLLHHPCLALVVLQPLGTDNSWREEDKEQGWELGARTWLRVTRRRQLETGGLSWVGWKWGWKLVFAGTKRKSLAPAFFFQLGTYDAAPGNLENIRSDCRALGVTDRGMRAQVVVIVCSVLL